MQSKDNSHLSGMTHSSKKLLSVQALRGIAAFLVLVYHIPALFTDDVARSGNALAFWNRGYAGVDMFFVISGFIIVYVSQETVPSVKSAIKFVYARFSRVFPLWWIFAGIMVLYFWVSYGQVGPPDRVNQGQTEAYIVKSLLLLPQKQVPVLGVGWTLIHEVFFYMIFTVGLLVPQKFIPYWLSLWVMLITINGFILPAPNHASSYFELLTHPLNLEFIMGAAAALLLSRGKLPASRFILAVGLVLFTLSLLAKKPSPEFFSWVRVGLYGVPCALLLLGIVDLERENKISVPKFLSTLGDWSYSLYLSHFLVLLTLKRIWNMGVLQNVIPGPLKWGAEGWLDNAVFVVVSIAACIIFSGFSYHFFEKTSLGFLRRKV